MKEGEFTFSATFSLPSPLSDLKVPNMQRSILARKGTADNLGVGMVGMRGE